MLLPQICRCISAGYRQIFMHPIRLPQEEKGAFFTWLTRAQLAHEINTNPVSTYWAGLNCISDKSLPLPLSLNPSTRRLLNSTEKTGPLLKKALGFKIPAHSIKNSKLRNSGFKEGQCADALDWRDSGAVSGIKD